jgi:hypothetical protein
MIDGKSWKAYAIRAVPALLLISCVMLVFASVDAWGATGQTRLPPWVPTVAGLEMALPMGLVALVCLRVVSRRTARRFSVMPFQLASGVLILVLATGQVSTGVQLTDAGNDGGAAFYLAVDENEDSALDALWLNTAAALP